VSHDMKQEYQSLKQIQENSLQFRSDWRKYRWGISWDWLRSWCGRAKNKLPERT